MIKNNDGSVTLTKQEVDWLNDNFQGGRHSIHAKFGHYTIIDNEGDACGGAELMMIMTCIESLWTILQV